MHGPSIGPRVATPMNLPRSKGLVISETVPAAAASKNARNKISTTFPWSASTLDVEQDMRVKFLHNATVGALPAADIHLNRRRSQ